MFTIDLLKGQGIPPRSRPEGIAAAAMAAAVPLVVMIVMVSVYLTNRVVINIQKQEIANYEKKIEALSDAMETHRAYQQRKNAIKKKILETANAIGAYEQWSDILVTIVEDMPHSLVLQRLSVDVRTARVKVPDKKNPDKMVEESVPARTLTLTLGGETNEVSDHAVKEFRQRLLLSKVLGPKLEDIPVSQEVDTVNNQEVITYEMKCIFKPQI